MLSRFLPWICLWRLSGLPSPRLLLKGYSKLELYSVDILGVEQKLNVKFKQGTFINCYENYAGSSLRSVSGACLAFLHRAACSKCAHRERGGADEGHRRWPKAIFAREGKLERKFNMIRCEAKGLHQTVFGLQVAIFF